MYQETRTIHVGLEMPSIKLYHRHIVMIITAEPYELLIVAVR